MNRILSVCFLVLVVVVGVSIFVLDESAGKVKAAAQTNLPLQKGISVQMATTTHASPMPDADKDDAFIIAVTANGTIYRGIDLISLPELTEKFRSTPFRRDQALYIKADARTLYGTVLSVLEATSGLVPQVLLADQPQSMASGNIVAPEGLAVSVGSAFPSGTVATVVELRPSAQEVLIRINNDEISQSALDETLRRHFQKGDDKVVLLRASVHLPFAEVVRAIDGCRAAGARVYLAEPEI